MITKKRFEEIICGDTSLAENIDEVWDELCTLGPDIAIMKDYDQCNPYHCYDLRMHTAYTVDCLKKDGLTDEEFRLLRIAAFFHDIGKPNMMTVVRDENRRIIKKSFGGHPDESCVLSYPILKNLGYQWEMPLLMFYIRCHDMFMHFLKPEQVPEGSRLAINEHNVKRQIDRWISRHRPTPIRLDDFYRLTFLCAADGEAHAEHVVTRNGTDSRAEIVGRMLMIRGVIEDLMAKDRSIGAITREWNVRELGGYTMRDGRKIIPGIFFRSGALADLSGDEREILIQQGVRTIIDLRSEHERRNKPDPFIPEAENYHVSAFIDKYGNELDLSPEGIARATGANVASPTESSVSRFLHYMYGAMLFDSRAYQEMFDAMLAERVPMLIHCTAGKDRTGVGAILILLALGADEDVIRKDYMMTNAYRWSAVQRFLNAHRDEIAERPELEEEMVAYEGVLEEAVDVVLRGILSRYSTYDEYLEKEFGLDEVARLRLQEMYLE